jgi:hypothetical protein
MLTRRDLIRASAALLGSARLRRAAGQLAEGANAGVSLVQHFTHSYLEDVSPDGTKVCIEDWQKSYQTFVWPNPPWRRKQPDQGSNQLRVLELGTWKSIYTGRFQSQVACSSFFADGQALFLQTSSYPTRQLAVVDLRTGESTKRADAVVPKAVHLMYATGGRTLLLDDFDGTTGRTESLALLDLPDYRERARVAYATQPRAPKSWEWALYFSADRKTVAYTFDDIVVCRRTEDLAPLWTRRIDPRLKGVHYLAVSADGGAVAAAVSDHHRPYEDYYTVIYDGRSGAEVARLPICGSYAMAISPDAKLLGVGEVRFATLFVHIYGLPSGALKSSLIVGTAPNGPHQFLSLGFTTTHGIEFTSDGQYVIASSGLGTKVWKLGELARS